MQNNNNIYTVSQKVYSSFSGWQSKWIWRNCTLSGSKTVHQTSKTSPHIQSKTVSATGGLEHSHCHQTSSQSTSLWLLWLPCEQIIWYSHWETPVPQRWIELNDSLYLNLIHHCILSTKSEHVLIWDEIGWMIAMWLVSTKRQEVSINAENNHSQ